MTSAVHDCGAKIAMQIAHAGNFAAGPLIGRPPMVVSDFEGLSKSARQEITTDYIREVVAAFADAARRAKAAGFDAVQIHSAHGYLLNQFLSPAFNRRQDEYGGSIENRARIHLEIYRAIRKVVGNEFPILIKLNCQDFAENGLSLEDSLQVGRMLADAGLDAIELERRVTHRWKAFSQQIGNKNRGPGSLFQGRCASFQESYQYPADPGGRHTVVGSGRALG